jgi:hypothetical protein
MFKKITLKHSLWFILFANLILWSVVLYNSNIKKKDIAIQKTESQKETYTKFKASKKYLPLENEAKLLESNQEQESWISKNWPIITSILTTIPTIVIKWKEMLEKFKDKKKHRKKI